MTAIVHLRNFRSVVFRSPNVCPRAAVDLLHRLRQVFRRYVDQHPGSEHHVKGIVIERKLQRRGLPDVDILQRDFAISTAYVCISTADRLL